MANVNAKNVIARKMIKIAIATKNVIVDATKKINN
jgi:hypothetical protein